VPELNGPMLLQSKEVDLVAAAIAWGCLLEVTTGINAGPCRNQGQGCLRRDCKQSSGKWQEAPALLVTAYSRALPGDEVDTSCAASMLPAG
jgi:hypothetical protein